MLFNPFVIRRLKVYNKKKLLCLGKKVDFGYEEATSQNLPHVTLEMFIMFIINNKDYISVEMRGVKTLR